MWTDYAWDGFEFLWTSCSNAVLSRIHSWNSVRINANASFPIKIRAKQTNKQTNKQNPYPSTARLCSDKYKKLSFIMYYVPKANLYSANHWFSYCKITLSVNIWEHFNFGLHQQTPLLFGLYLGLAKAQNPRRREGEEWSQSIYSLVPSMQGHIIFTGGQSFKVALLTRLQVSANHSLPCTLKRCRATLSPIVYPAHMFVNGSFIKRSLDYLNSSMPSVFSFFCWDHVWKSRIQ